ncbi:MAG: cation:proton antiporter [Clostridia bacterium]|nr:cation:proton antiporter [Clostridia bacterium]
MNLLLSVAVALFAGLMMTRLFKKIKLNLPDVTAFLIAGVLVGPYALGRIGVTGLGFTSMDEISQVGFLSNVALGFIAFDIGNEFRLGQLKKTGKTATVIGIVQSVAATLFVDAALIALHFILGPEILPLPVAITLGAIASATAPAATLMVVRQYKAKGPLTDLLLPIVALDDAVGLVLFAVSFGVAQALDGGNVSIVSVIFNPMLEILCSLILGSAMGWLLTQLEKLFFSNKNRLSMTIAFVVTTIAVSSEEIPLGKSGLKISFSSLLVCMMLGTVFCNLSDYSADIMKRSERWTAPLYTVFFVLSGAQLELSVFKSGWVILIGVVYIIIRCAGKYSGAYVSSVMMKCDANVKKHLGITLFPQAGVALGMVVSAQALGEAHGGIIRNIVLFSVLIYELVGPMLTKRSLEQAGEIVKPGTEAENRARFERKEKR